MANTLETILNWRRVSPRLSLSGQPDVAQFEALRDDGVTCVINLAPSDDDTALAGEAALMAALGLSYVYIPVDFDAPTEEDYTAFCDALAAHETQRTHVHCIYNARVSAFMLRRARDGKGGDPDAAFAVMDSIWRPGGVWAAFLGHDADRDKPNRYLGHDC